MDEEPVRNAAEQRVWAAFARGTQVDLGPGEPADAEFDPAGWGPDRTIRAEVIARLLLGAVEPEPGHVSKVVLSGARLTGPFHLNGGELRHELTLERCWFDEIPDLGDATGKGMFAVFCRFPGLNAWGLKVSTAHFAGSRFTGPVLLNYADIAGDLELSGASLTNEDGFALNAQDITIGLSLVCTNGFSATGRMILDGARIGGYMDFSGAKLSDPQGVALLAPNCTVGSDLLCGNDFEARGEVDINGMKVQGRVSMPGARLDNPGGVALGAAQLAVERDVVLTDLVAHGQINLHLAKIGGMFDLRNVRLDQPPEDDRVVLEAELLTVGQAVLCRDCTFDGTVDLNIAKIGTGIDLSGTVLRASGEYALMAESISGSDFRCIGGFTATGTVNLAAARLDRLALHSGELSGDAADVDLYQATIGSLDLAPAALTRRMRLSGLTYQRLDVIPEGAGGSRQPVSKLLRWLRNDPDGYHPQPYEQLATYYRSNGDDREARRILLAKRRAQRRHIGRGVPLLGWIRRLPGWAMDALAGYGYAPGRALFWLAVALATGTWVLRGAVPAEGLDEPTGSRTGNAFLLAADSLVPTSPFGVRDAAELTGTAQVTAIVLQVLGYALSVAVLPAVTRALSRTDK